MRVISVTKHEFEDSIAKEETYLRIELAPLSLKFEARNIKNVVGFMMGSAIVVTDLDEKQVGYYEEQKYMV